ncbi:unnamed protein product [Paramecium pentaurelia]|uniref:protein-serine/threonine phosphatase n=1 Tax=Paramecium pentaurelia TaxID=43138 RepID=A0A8S1SQ37_9CILI|nr:unnamed protein product [Paramecium pentaurelia]
MGSGASIEQEQQNLNLPAQNNIFIDEGVGIEQSQLSRKWTTKMTMFKNLETKNFMESQFQNKSPKQTIKLEQKSSVVYSDDSDQISKSSSPSVKSSKMHFPHQKKKNSFHTDSEEESDIEEKQLYNDRRQTKFQNFQSDDSFEERDDNTKKIKQLIYQAEENITSRKSSINSRSDQQFLANFEIKDIAETINLRQLSLPHQYPLCQLYIRTQISEQKLLPGKDKLVKLSCRQNLQDSESEDSIKNQNDSKSEIQTDYSPEQLLNQIGIAVISKKGNKNDTAPLAQDYLIYNDNYQKILILSNGHGEFGEKISNLTYRMVEFQSVQFSLQVILQQICQQSIINIKQIDLWVVVLVQNKTQNNIFIDEGVGIEQSQLSRKWTTKMTMFKNLETKNFMESQFQNKSPKQTIKLEQKSSVVYSDDSDQISKSSSPSVKSSKMHFPHQKKKNSFHTDSEEESDIEEKQLYNDRRQTKFQNFQSDDSFEERDDNTKKIKQLIYQAEENITSRKSSINSRSDQQFLANFEIKDIAETINLRQLSLPHQYPLCQLYIRTQISEQKLLPGKDKLVKLSCRQNLQDSESEDSIKNQNDSKSEIQTDYSPEQLLNQIGIAVISKKGNKNDTAPLAQDYLIYNDNYQKILILSNGHGEFGEKISNLTYRMVFHYLIRTSTFYTNPMRGLETIFKKLQNKLKMHIEKKKLDDTHNILLSGCVITVIIQRDSKLYCAQIGDNRTYIYKEQVNQNRESNIIAQTLPIHTPNESSEKARIFNSGGEVRKIPQGEEYVFVRGRLYPQLHVTRSLGDVIAHVIGVSSQPFFREYDITIKDTFLILSTASVYAYQDENDVMNHLSGFSLHDIKSACESLYKQCKNSWILNEGMFEDMTIILLWLVQQKEPK